MEPTGRRWGGGREALKFLHTLNLNQASSASMLGENLQTFILLSGAPRVVVSTAAFRVRFPVSAV